MVRDGDVCLAKNIIDKNKVNPFCEWMSKFWLKGLLSVVKKSYFVPSCQGKNGS